MSKSTDNVRNFLNQISILSDINSILEEHKRLFKDSDISLHYRAEINELVKNIKANTKARKVDDDELPGEISLTNPTNPTTEIVLTYNLSSIFAETPEGQVRIDPKTKKFILYGEIGEFGTYLIKLGYEPTKKL